MTENQTNQTLNQVSKRGGSRKGSGRKRNGSDEKWFEARGINPLTAAEIIQKTGEEWLLWKRMLYSDDDRIALQALIFLTQMRDGKAAQTIAINSTSITLAAKDVESAKMIAREMRAEIEQMRDANVLPAELGSTSVGLELDRGQPHSITQLATPAELTVITQSMSDTKLDKV